MPPCLRGTPDTFNEHRKIVVLANQVTECIEIDDQCSQGIAIGGDEELDVVPQVLGGLTPLVHAVVGRLPLGGTERLPTLSIAQREPLDDGSRVVGKVPSVRSDTCRCNELAGNAGAFVTLLQRNGCRRSNIHLAIPDGEQVGRQASCGSKRIDGLRHDVSVTRCRKLGRRISDQMVEVTETGAESGPNQPCDGTKLLAPLPELMDRVFNVDRVGRTHGIKPALGVIKYAVEHSSDVFGNAVARIELEHTASLVALRPYRPGLRPLFQGAHRTTAEPNRTSVQTPSSCRNPFGATRSAACSASR